MSRIRFAFAFILVTTLCGASADAETIPGYLSALTPGVSIGTLGIGPEVDTRISGTPFGFRLGANFFSLTHRFTNGDITYKTNADLANGGFLADWYPFTTGFRLSGGLKINGNQAKVAATPYAGSLVSVNGHIYDLSGSAIDGKVGFRTLAPYTGFGFAGRVWDSLTLGADFGVMFHGTPRASLSAGGPIIAVAGFAGDLAAEQRSLQNKVSDFTVYPVLQFTAGWRF